MDLNERPRWPCSWNGEEGEECTKWAQSNGQWLCQRHFCQYEQQQRLCTATELAGIINNDVAAPVPNIADNIDHNEQLADKIDYNEQLIDAAAVHNIGNKAINSDPQYVVVEETNDTSAPVDNIADSIDDNKQLSNVALNIDLHDVADGKLTDAVVGNGNNETHYAAVHNVGIMLTAPTIRYLNDELELRDGRMHDLEARIVDLESKMTALSDTVS
jgi:hypothetical protein